MDEVIILSIPFGPKLVRIQSATALAAMMFDERTSFCFSFPENFCSLKPLEAAAANEAGAAVAIVGERKGEGRERMEGLGGNYVERECYVCEMYDVVC